MERFKKGNDIMNTGYVYKISANVFAILSYAGTTKTYVKIFRDDCSVMEACDKLAREYAGIFRVANRDEQKWGEQMVARYGVYFGI